MYLVVVVEVTTPENVASDKCGELAATSRTDKLGAFSLLFLPLVPLHSLATHLQPCEVPDPLSIWHGTSVARRTMRWRQ